MLTEVKKLMKTPYMATEGLGRGKGLGPVRREID